MMPPCCWRDATSIRGVEVPFLVLPEIRRIEKPDQSQFAPSRHDPACWSGDIGDKIERVAQVLLAKKRLSAKHLGFDDPLR